MGNLRENKQHRWVVSVVVACDVQMNEDRMVFARTIYDPMSGAWPSHVWCWDCERDGEEVWGEPCLAEFDDHSLPREVWDRLKEAYRAG